MSFKPESIRPDGNLHRMLQALSGADRTETTLHNMAGKASGHLSFPRFQNTILSPAVEAGLVSSADRGLYHITALGIEALACADRAAAKTKVVAPVKANLYVPSQGTYDGAELRRVAHRPGAFDHIDCPSLVNGQFVPYKVAHVTALATSS